MSEPVRQMPVSDRATPTDRPGRAQPGPLRDWLATMKATTASRGTITIRPAPTPAPQPVAEPAHALTADTATDLDETLLVLPTDEAETKPDAAEEPWPEAVSSETADLQTSRADAFLPEALPPEAPSAPEPQPVVQLLAQPAAQPAPKGGLHSAARIELTRDLSELMAENLMLKNRLRLENERYEGLQAMVADELRVLRGDAEADMKILDAVCAERDQLKSLTANAARKMHEMSARIESDVALLAEMRSERDLWMARAEALAQPLFQRR